MIHLQSIPTKDLIRQIGDIICSNLNNLPNNKSTVVVDSEDFFWIDNNAVWSDIISSTVCLQIIENYKGRAYQGFYEKYQPYIATFFRDSSMPQHVISSLFAPQKNSVGGNICEETDNAEKTFDGNNSDGASDSE